MELLLKNTPLFLTILLTGLSAGLFYAWEVSVIPGTKQISDRSYLEAMQFINRAILNPAFYTIFLGSLICLFLSSYMQYRAGNNYSLLILLTATLCYLIGTFGVTVFGNVPLNESLDTVNLLNSNDEALKSIRTIYEKKWNYLHSIRTVFSVLTFIISLLNLFIHKSN